VRERWGDSDGDEEGVSGLKYIDGMDIVVVGVWGMVDCSDGKEEEVDLVCIHV